jgi:hypothetical protein
VDSVTDTHGRSVGFLDRNDIHTKFYEDWFWHSANYLDNLRGCSVGATKDKDFLITRMIRSRVTR